MTKPFRLLDEIRANVNDTAGRTCAVKLVIETLTPDDHADLVAAFNDPSVTSAAIYRALNHRGSNVSQFSLQRHRRGECRCG